ncbi:HAD family hydrolase [Sulfobacillus sp. hq2]|uniref:HAD family hydrolase n=1 Tax=Sulfobacillus TaxID=28033 RepID=UPI001304C26E|nr:HAD family hydrolase [Sulfobacillus sp. hq2]
MIRMIACDLDGTLLDEAAHVRPQAAHELHQLWLQGLHVVVATGRSWRTAVRVQRELGISGPIVAHNGAYVFNPALPQPDLYRHGVPITRTQEMMRWGFRHHAHLRCYLGYANPVLFTQFPPDYDVWQKPEDQVITEDTAIETEPLEILMLGNRKVTQFIDDFGYQGPDYELTVFSHIGYQEVNICAPRVTKAEGLQHLAHLYHIKPHEVLAIGDGMNDLPMLQWAGVSVAVGEGLEACHQVADYITPVPCSDPVSAALSWAWRKHLLRPLPT